MNESDEQKKLTELSEQFDRLTKQYSDLKTTNSYLGKNNVTLMKEIRELHDALMLAVVVLLDVSNDQAIMNKRPKIKQGIDEVLLNERVIISIPFIRHEQGLNNL